MQIGSYCGGAHKKCIHGLHKLNLLNLGKQQIKRVTEAFVVSVPKDQSVLGQTTSLWEFFFESGESPGFISL